MLVLYLMPYGHAHQACDTGQFPESDTVHVNMGGLQKGRCTLQRIVLILHFHELLLHFMKLVLSFIQKALALFVCLLKGGQFALQHAICCNAFHIVISRIDILRLQLCEVLLCFGQSLHTQSSMTCRHGLNARPPDPVTVWHLHGCQPSVANICDKCKASGSQIIPKALSHG